MPGQDDWKIELEKMWHVVSYGDMVSFIENTLSSQAHALKEKMKACVPTEFKNKPVDEYIRGHNNCRRWTLSAIESIEI